MSVLLIIQFWCIGLNYRIKKLTGTRLTDLIRQISTQQKQISELKQKNDQSLRRDYRIVVENSSRNRWRFYIVHRDKKLAMANGAFKSAELALEAAKPLMTGETKCEIKNITAGPDVSVKGKK